MRPQKPDVAPDKSKDELQRLLQESLKKKRPRWFRIALATILGAIGLLAVLAWLVWPKGEPPPLTVVAFDDLGVVGTAVALQGRLEAPVDVRGELSGKDMVFVDGQGLLAPGQQSREVPAKTGPHGEAACAWTFSPETVQGDFLLRLIGDKFRPGMEDRGRVFLYPGATPLCLVQIDATLTRSNDDAWRKENIQDIVPAPGAAEALQQARQQGFEIVYLALAADRPTLYQKMRGWVRHRSAEEPSPLPAGAVLGRFILPWGDQDKTPWQETGERLGRVFLLSPTEKIAKHLAIVGTIDVARQCHAAGVRTVYLGAGNDLPPDVERVPDWEEVRRALEK